MALRPTRHVLFSTALLVAAPLAAAEDVPGPVATTEVPHEAVLAELPFLESDEPNRIVVDLAPEGTRPFRMLLDTGAASTVLTPRYAREAGVSVRPHKSSPYRRETRLGRDVQFWVDTQTSDTASKTGFEYGLLGGDFLEPYVVELDFDQRRVRFLDAARYRVPETASEPDEVVVPLRMVAKRPHADVVKGDQKADVILDTGAPPTLLLSGSAAERLALGPPLLTGLRVAGVVGSTPMDLVEADGLLLGSEPLGKLPVEVAPRGFYNQGGADDSLVGYDVLSRYRVRIDYPRSRLWLKRRPGAESTLYGVPFEPARSAGILAQPTKDGLAVANVFPDSPAAKLGLAAGDVLPRPPDAPETGFERAVLERIATGGPVTVRRPHEGVAVDVTLPESHASAQEAPRAPKEHYLQANTEDADGMAATVRFAEPDMPLRVYVDAPRRPALRASGAATRAAVMDGVRVWEQALQPAHPWFRIAFVDDESEAQIRIRWKRRLGGNLLGQGAIGWVLENGALRVEGRLEYTTQRCEGADLECLLDADDLRLVVAHEFGHALGLGHCLDCDSIMSYSFETRDRVLVTELDVRTFGVLSAVPNGLRSDGRVLGAPAAEAPSGSGPSASAAEHPAE